MPEPEEPQPNSVDERQLASKKRAIKAAEVQEKLYMQQVLATREGRAVLWAILIEAGVYHISFDASNPHVTSFNEGRRNVGNRLLARIRLASSEKLAIMEQEAQKAQEDMNA
jgi:hypothetical protein